MGLIFPFIIILVAFIMQNIGRRDESDICKSRLEALEKRYAAGKIAWDEFEITKENLQDSCKHIGPQV